MKEVVKTAGTEFDRVLKMGVMDLIYNDGSTEDPVERLVENLQWLCEELDCVEGECTEVVRRNAH